VGRFINGDDIRLLLVEKKHISSNLFTYGVNNAISNSDPYGYWVTTLGVTIGATVILGVSASAAIIFDGQGNFGLLISIYLASLGFALGASGFVGFFWQYSNVYSYKNAVMNTHSVGYCIGVDIVHDYPQYPKNLKSRLVGFQISFGAKSFSITYTPNSIFAYYIPLNKSFYNAWNSLQSTIKKVRIRFVVKRNNSFLKL